MLLNLVSFHGTTLNVQYFSDRLIFEMDFRTVDKFIIKSSLLPVADYICRAELKYNSETNKLAGETMFICAIDITFN
ncbi:MAG: hypothetical protein ABIO55_17610 [Ginsengibacter sp.]